MTRVDATTGAVRANAKPQHIELERFLCRDSSGTGGASYRN
jgi:hypothetical protein